MSSLCNWSLLIFYIICAQTIGVTFEQSIEEVDRFCFDIHSTQAIPICDDIQRILDGCGNTTFMQILTKNSLSNMTADQCTFLMRDAQFINKSYVLSSRTTPSIITFEPLNDSDLLITDLTQTFLFMDSYQGTIHINNIAFTTSSTHTTSVIHVINTNASFQLNINQCEFHNMHNIIHIADTAADPSHSITIVFQDCDIYNNTAEDKALLFINRNNVWITFDSTTVNNNYISEGTGGIIHWKCQETSNIPCGSLIITNECQWHDINGAIFTIDVSNDPQNTRFNLSVYTSDFRNVVGPIFNLNSMNQTSMSDAYIISNINTMIRIDECTFSANGNKSINGAIFSINAATVADIGVHDSVFSNNEASSGAIFDWHCARVNNEESTNICGYIELYNSTFIQNTIQFAMNSYESDVLFFSGSLFNLQIYNMVQVELSLAIKECNITQNAGSLVYIESNVLSNSVCPDGDIDTGIFIESSTFSENVNCLNQCNACDACNRNGNAYKPGLDAAATVISIIGVECIAVIIDYSVFINNEGGEGDSSQPNGIILTADYVPTLSIHETTFIGNRRIESLWPLFYIGNDEDDDAYSQIQITDSVFTDKEGDDYTSQLDIGVLEIDTYVDLTIKNSSFHSFTATDAALFYLLEGNVSIDDTTFTSNRFDGCALKLQYGDVFITNSIIGYNDNVWDIWHTGSDADRGFVWIASGDITAINITAYNNKIAQNALFFTNYGRITLSYGEYRDNTLYEIDVTAIASAHTIHVMSVAFINNSGTCLMYQDELMNPPQQTDDGDAGYVYSSNGSYSSNYTDYYETNSGNGSSIDYNEYIPFTLSITNSIFIGNTNILRGGSVVYSNAVNTTLDIRTSYFANNTVVMDQDKCEEVVSEDTGNRKQDDTCLEMIGGALYVTRGNISMKECRMEGNEAYQGGFAYIGEFSTVSISNSIIDSNVASPGYPLGGFIVIDTYTSLYMTDVNSSHNYAGSGGVIYAVEYNDITLERCRFVSNMGYFNGFGLGGAIYLYLGHFTCRECITDGNKGDSGGFIALDESDGYFIDMVSSNDEATKGAVVYITEGEHQFDAINCSITAPIAYYGAFVYSNGENFVNLNGVTVQDAQVNSSVIFVDKGDVTIDQSTFINNTAFTSAGVIYLGDNNEISITKSKFYNNSATEYGGCIYASDIVVLNINDTVFQFNKAKAGGAIVISTGQYSDETYHESYIAIQNTLFDNNIAYVFGGSLWIKRDGYDDAAELYSHNIILLNNTWNNNKAIQGGAIWINFEFDVMVASGTGCYTEISQSQAVYVKDNTFTNNYAVSANNSAYTSSMVGGAFWFSCLNVNISNTHFDSCHAETTGGVGYIGYSTAWMHQCYFTSTDMVQSNGQLFSIANLEDTDDYFKMTNTSIYGFQQQSNTDIYSLMSVTEISSMTFENILFYENKVPLFYEQKFLCPLVTFYRCKFESNTAASIIDMDHSTLQREHKQAIDATTAFDDVEFKNNNVSLWMIRLLTSNAQITHSIIENNINNGIISTFIHVRDATIVNTEFISNTGLYEGILSIDKYAIATIQNTVFKYNHVDIIGGGIRSYADVLSIDNCIFWNNSADIAGAHIAHYEGQLLINNSTFSYGYTQGNGGAIWREKYSARTNMITNISQSIFEYNFAGFHGGAIFHGTVSRNKATNVVLDDVEFIENMANISGAAIYIKNIYDITLDITNDSVYYDNNTAHQIPGDVMSLPTQVHVTSDVDSFCPNCSLSIAVYTTDIFDAIWSPHYFHEYLWSETTNIENITSLKDAATLFRRSIDIKQSISSSASVTHPTLDVAEQSAYFKTGNGTEILRYYPAVYGDNLTLTVIGLTFGGAEIFDNKSIYFSVTQCLSHQEAYLDSDSDGFTCFWCGEGFYRFIPTHTDSCHDCSAQAGLVCNGIDDIYVENDHYPVYDDYSELQVVECDSGTCCLDAECSVWNISSLCPSHRDGSSQLCSACEPGYSVSPYSRECIQCDSWAMIGRFGFMYFFYPFCFYGGLIWWWGHSNTYDASMSFWEVYVFKTMMFFYQVTPSINVLIPDPSETTNKIDIIEGIFNFQIPLPSICAFEGMTNLHKLLLPLVMPFVCVLWMFIFWLLHKIGCCDRSRDSECCKNNFAFKKCGAFALHFFVVKAMVKFIISIYAVVTRLSFYLLKCQEFTDSTSRLYYAADVECWESWSIVPLMGTLIAGLCPILLLWKLFGDRQSRDNTALWHLLTLGYKKRAWWYEPYRMFCRLFVISIVVISVPELYRLSLIRNITFGFLIIHIWFLPYSKQYRQDVGFDINHTETLCLFILCILAMLADYEHTGTLWAYTILKALPVAIIPLLIIWRYILHSKFQQFVPEPVRVPKGETQIFFSPRTPMDQSQRVLQDDGDDSAQVQGRVVEEELYDDDDLYDAKEQEPIGLLSIPRPETVRMPQKSKSFTLKIPSVGRLRSMNRSRSNDSDFGVSIQLQKPSQSTKSKRGKLYKSIGQHDNDDIDDDVVGVNDDEYIKSTRL